jgi:hypothetical protein
VESVFLGKPARKRPLSENLGVDGRMGSKWILARLAGGVEWIQLAQDSTGGGVLCMRR